MLKIGLTGNIASGKTTVANVWRKMGARVIDVDELAHNLYRPGTKIWQKIIKTFGTEILYKDKTINRATLGDIVFNQCQDLNKLEKIMYPAIIKELRKQLAQVKGRVVVADMAVLFGAGAHKLFDKVVLVKVSKPNQLKRLLKSRKLTRSQALCRIKSFKLQTGKIALSDYIIDGNKRLTYTQRQAKELFRKFA